MKAPPHPCICLYFSPDFTPSAKGLVLYLNVGPCASGCTSHAQAPCDVDCGINWLPFQWSLERWVDVTPYSHPFLHNAGTVCRMDLELCPCTDKLPQMAQGPGYLDARVSGSWQSADFQEVLSTFLSLSLSRLDGLITGPIPLHRCISSFMLPVWQIMAWHPRPCITVKPLVRLSWAREGAVTLCY